MYEPNVFVSKRCGESSDDRERSFCGLLSTDLAVKINRARVIFFSFTRLVFLSIFHIFSSERRRVHSHRRRRYRYDYFNDSAIIIMTSVMLYPCLYRVNITLQYNMVLYYARSCDVRNTHCCSHEVANDFCSR